MELDHVVLVGPLAEAGEEVPVDAGLHVQDPGLLRHLDQLGDGGGVKPEGAVTVHALIAGKLFVFLASLISLSLTPRWT